VELFIGTSGYNYDAWRGSFYPEKLSKAKMLSYYATRLSSVEINYTFYRKPTEKALEGWAGQTPAGFRFALKAWQRITHQKRLLDSAELTQVFCTTARALGDKLGPILFQLPPNMKKDAPRLKEFLAAIPAGIEAAFEWRHASWFDDEIFSLLRDAGAALCVAESEELATPFERTAPFGYFRLRRQDYDDAAIARGAERIAGGGFAGGVHVYFKHEDSAQGAAWAEQLAKLLAK
jgi:uncharacterized protein YecE (DUF72 family)